MTLELIEIIFRPVPSDAKFDGYRLSFLANLLNHSTMADLYDEIKMPTDLRKAHRVNNRTVMEAYNWNWHNIT